MTRVTQPRSFPKPVRAVVGPIELLWALIGLLLTVGGTFLEAFVASPPWAWSTKGIPAYSLGVTYQIGAVLLVGCLGGKNAGVLSQIAYLTLGLTWFPIFAQGGGIGYVHEPSFGYLVGFIPGAWICGYLAFKTSPKLESLAASCIAGLALIHLTGIFYLGLANAIGLTLRNNLPLMEAILKYSLYLLPGQLAVVCATTVIAFVLRQLMFY